ncbi:P-loop containing nucleoside triphosphate hydrolase protein [Sporodiniella umbellata]|nr:P-loop containing nucleoside triphosphate hydrolase protein [Sporodiniella umbellata]
MSTRLPQPESRRRLSSATPFNADKKKADLRRLLLDNDSEEEEKDLFRSSAPLLDAYGVPMSPARAARSLTQTNHFSLPASDLNQKIRVCVKKRPLNKKELDKSEKDMAPTLGTRSLQINEPKLRLNLSKFTEQHTFTFDDVFDSDAPNTTVYERTALPLVNYIFKGGKATCFAYGQTGSGKTYTMLDSRHGLYILAARDIFSLLRKPENEYLTAWIGLYEIYQGQLYDLLNQRKKLFAREDGKNNVIITGLKEYPIDNVDKLVQVFDYGSSVRTTGSTGANNTSSRSHAVLQILLKHKTNKKKIHGKLSFIDLAGSERGADRGETDTKTRMEGAEINKSLLALKECIRALDKDKRHTPFRQSKLTQVLKDSFVGHSRTCMVATISPGGSNSEHTLNTLRYADRVKELKGERDKRKGTAQDDGYSATEDVYPTQDFAAQDTYEEYEDYPDDEEEYFSNESDILDDDTFNEENLFDVDFPHEQERFMHSNSSLTRSPTFLETQPEPSLYTTATSSSKPIPMAHRSPYESPRPSSLQTKQSLKISRSFSMYSADSDTSSSYSQRVSLPPVPNDLPSFSGDHIDEFVRFHRAEIREISDCTKRENKLVANLQLELSSGLDEEGIVSQTKSTSEFLKYLQDLDELLEHKLAAVEALRDRISDTVGQIEV